MNSTLYKAILSLDAYNRGYDAGININENSIGNATINTDSFDLGLLNEGTQNEIRVDENASFYAVAYSYNGETIISYRGTDDASDIWNGWTTGVGNANSHSARA